jgi:regulator of sirC expression with transglutaminase-like and TPR domain
MPYSRVLASLAGLLILTLPGGADTPPVRGVEQVAETAQKSVAVITVLGRDGKRQGLGTGFVVRPDGLIATNLHVIGEARPVRVELADGKRYDVTAVHASDRSLDLALVQIDAHDLPALSLGDSAALKNGQPVVAIGNPHGLIRSVVSGVVSGTRSIDGRKLIQVAIPIEPGNSGGPLLDRRGRVVGILTMKSQVTPNLGFAVAINSLKPLLERPNPVPMARWLTIGALDPATWRTRFGAHWRQRAGRIQVEGAGSGFGGRSLCLWRRPVPAEPYEVAVGVRLDDEDGAAGLVFHADGGDRHYGFYPTAGQLRLTRFDGPDVFSWKILDQKPSRHYRPGEWNTLKVRVAKDGIKCYVNDHVVFESADDELTGGRVGLAKFRDTRAEFRHFRVAAHIPPATPPADVLARITRSVRDLAPGRRIKPETVEALAPEGDRGVAVLRERARALEEQAAQLKLLARAVHCRQVDEELARLFREPEEKIDLLRAALLIARLDNDDLDVDAYRQQVDRMGRELLATLPKKADDRARLTALNRYLFTEHGYHGSRSEYYTRSNSYLNEVIDDREGIPITLCVLYLELAQRVGLKVVGVPLPGHFMVRQAPARGDGRFIDVYEGGKVLTRAEAEEKVQTITGQPPGDEEVAPATKRAIVVRMLHNLLNLARGDRDLEGMLRYLDAIVAVAPDAGRDRGLRAVVRAQSGRRDEARQDIDWLLEHKPDDVDLNAVRALQRVLDGKRE